VEIKESEMKRLLSTLVWDKMKENYDIKEIHVLIK